MISYDFVIYNLYLDVYRDFMKKNKAWSELKEIFGASGEFKWLG